VREPERASGDTHYRGFLFLPDRAEIIDKIPIGLFFDDNSDFIQISLYHAPIFKFADAIYIGGLLVIVSCLYQCGGFYHNVQ
jgi:hypothetical protein